jgi:ketosteroid isomerase-like protein
MAELTPLERVVAHDAIRQLVAHYAVALDARDLDRLVALFVDDVQVGRDGRGREALRAAFAASLEETTITVLNVGTHLVDVRDADHATGIVYCRGELQVGERWIVQMIQYRDVYERRRDRWYFVRRRHLLWYGRDVGSSPVGLEAADWPEHHTGWGELPEAWASVDLPDLPTDDA